MLNVWAQTFRELSKIYHPDKTVGNVELQDKFVKISDAVCARTTRGFIASKFGGLRDQICAT